jgi:hypothetical protein
MHLATDARPCHEIGGLLQPPCGIGQVRVMWALCATYVEHRLTMRHVRGPWDGVFAHAPRQARVLAKGDRERPYGAPGQPWVGGQPLLGRKGAQTPPRGAQEAPVARQ